MPDDATTAIDVKIAAPKKDVDRTLPREDLKLMAEWHMLVNVASARWLRGLAILFLVLTVGRSLAAQQVTVALSTNSPAASGIQGGTAFTQELAAFTLSASGGAVQINGITLTVGGTGDFVNDLDPSTGLSVWQDDGDGSFNSALDTNLGSTGGASPTITVNFTSTLTVPDATSVDVWVVADFLASAGASIPDTYQVSVAGIGDVNVQAPATVSLGTPAPDSAQLSVVIFFVSSIDPASSYHNTFFRIYGSGFTPPVSLSIGGIDLGTGTVNGANTFASGWVIPDLGPNDGYHDVVVTTSLLGPITLTQQFYYDSTKPGGRTGNNGSDCSTHESGTSASFLVLLATLAALFAAPRIARRVRG